MDKIPFDPYDFFGYLATGLVALVGMELLFGFPQILHRDFKLIDGALVVVGIYVFGQLVATPAKAVLEGFVVDKLLARPSINLFRERGPRVRRLLFPGFYKRLPKPIRRNILDKVFDDGVTSGEALFLRVRYSREVLENQRLLAKLDSFIAKYGFARNTSFTLLALGSALFLKTIVFGGPTEQMKYALAALTIGVMLFYRYLKFFRQYSFEMFNVWGSTKWPT